LPSSSGLRSRVSEILLEDTRRSERGASIRRALEVKRDLDGSRFRGCIASRKGS
jgi:hypothetical protein